MTRKYFILFLENRFPAIVDVESKQIIHQPMIDSDMEGEDEAIERAIADFEQWVIRNYPGQEWSDYVLVATPNDVCRLCSKFGLNTVEKRQSKRVFGYVTCDRCFNTYCKWCAFCDEGFHVNSMRQARGRDNQRILYCIECFDEHCYQCEHCGSANAGSQCHRCDIGVTYYSAKPTYDPVGQGPIWYGIELEVEVKGGERDEEYGERNPYVDEVAQRCKPLFPKNYCIMKEDSSLEGGFEICTRPASVEYHKNAFEKFLKRPPKDLRSWNGGTCGIHVHISRAPLTELQIGKMLVFIHDFTEFTQRIAQRISPFGDFSAKKKITDARYHGEARDGQARHEALNLTNNSTVELRIFRGTLNRETFWKCIEFTEALVHFTATGQFGINEICPENFIKFALRRQKQWPNLAAFLRRPYKPMKAVTQRENNTYRPNYRQDDEGRVRSRDAMAAFNYNPPMWTARPYPTSPPPRVQDDDLCRDRNCRECFPETPLEIEYDREMTRARAQQLVDSFVNPPARNVETGAPVVAPGDLVVGSEMHSPGNWVGSDWSALDEEEFNLEVQNFNDMLMNEGSE